MAGGGLTIVAYLVMLVVFLCELSSFFETQTYSSLLLDYAGSPLMQINFDIDMRAIDCKHLEVLVMDHFGKEAIRSEAKSYQLSELSAAGDYVRVTRSRDSLYEDDKQDDEEVEHKRLAAKLEKADGKKDLDADWASSHDGFRHQSFQHVIQYHDFTLINFFAEWCGHCRQFAPMWRDLTERIMGQQYKNSDGHPRTVFPVIKVNCVDFQHICREQGIDAFPSIRLYKSDGTFSRFQGMRSIASIEQWVTSVVESTGHHSHSGWQAHHSENKAGCNARGYLQVPRTPGHLELFAGGGDQNLAPAMTNASHIVKHLSFSEPLGEYAKYNRRWKRMPPEARSHAALLDNRHFNTQGLHETWEHHLKVVRTVTSLGDTYQFSHYSRNAKLNVTEVPQARFYYDLEPFAMEVRQERKRWYDLTTSLFAVLGGVFVTMRLATMATLAVGGVSRDRNGLLS